MSLVTEMFPNVDDWGPREWFDRLDDAVKKHDEAIRNGDELLAITYRRVISSSAFTLSREFGHEVKLLLGRSLDD